MSVIGQIGRGAIATSSVTRIQQQAVEDENGRRSCRHVLPRGGVVCWTVVGRPF
jgi:hypothetical protein